MPKPPRETLGKIKPPKETLGKIKPPRETLGRKILSKLKETISNNKKIFDFLMAITIFNATAIEILSWTKNTDNVAIITDYGDYNLVYWYPLLSSIIILNFSFFFVLKVILYKSCIYSKIVTGIYFLVQIINVLSILFKITMNTYDLVVYPILLYSIILLILLKIVRWIISE